MTVRTSIRSNVRLLAACLLAAPFFFFFSSAARAADAPAADEILKKADVAANASKDQRYVMTMTIEGSGPKKVAKIEMMQKGLDKRLLRFLAPGDVKGTTLLIDGPNSMYIYLPQFQKIRRIAGHAKSQGFMDSDFTNDDMATVAYGRDFTPSLLETTDKAFKIKLTPKPGADTSYEALEAWVDKTNFVMTQIDYMVGGKAVRRQTRQDVKTFASGINTPTLIMMEDLTKAHKTTLTMDDVKINSGLSDDLFTKQSLERGR